MPLVLITPPAEEPLSVEEAQEHLRLEVGGDDVYLVTLIKGARRHVEQVCRRALITQTWDLLLDAFPAKHHRRESLAGRSGTIELEMGAVQTLTSVKYFDAGSVEKTLTSSEYVFDSSSEPARIVPVDTWPETADRPNAVAVRYSVGYGNAEDVPEDIKSALLLIVGHLYEHRESEIVGAVSSPLHLAVDSLLSPYRMASGY